MKKSLELDIDIKEVKQSNLFLRALWTEIRSRFGGCSWQFSPFIYKDQKLIRFGRFSTKDETLGAIEVYISYVRKGGIHKIILNDIENHHSVLVDIIEKLKKEYNSKIQKVKMEAIIRANYPISSYETEDLTINPLQDLNTQVRVNVTGFDKTDLQFAAKKKFNTVLDVIAGNIWHKVVYSKSSKKEILAKHQGKNVYSGSINYGLNDERLEKEGFIYLPKNAIEIINLISNDMEPTLTLSRLLSACKLYHSALKVETLRDIFTMNDLDLYEILVTKYMSALEVLALPEDKVKKCGTCNQDVHSISKRVKELLMKVYDNESFVKTLHTNYNRRSKYLHTGKYFSTRSYLGTSIPQLTNDDDLVETQSTYENGTLKFAVGECIEYCQNQYFIQNS